MDQVWIVVTLMWLIMFELTFLVPLELGYVTTPICMVDAALTILQETDKLPDEYVNTEILHLF